jgi:hypothetical protein
MGHIHRANVVPAALFVPLGGWGMSFINKYTKMAAYDIWSYVSRKGKYELSDSDPLTVVTPPTSENHNEIIQNYWGTYNKWHLQYNEDVDPFNAYLCTQRGFFTINLNSWTILKALPSSSPCLAQSIQSIYNTLNRNLSALSSPDDKQNLEKIQLVCLLNLLLKDLFVLNISKGKAPRLLKQLIKGIHTLKHNKSTELISIQNLFSGNEEEWMEFKGFLEKSIDDNSYRKTFFYRNNPPTQEENISTTGVLGMIFKYTIQDKIVLIATDDGTNRESLLNESVLMTGQWVCVFKLQYYIL